MVAISCPSAAIRSNSAALFSAQAPLTANVAFAPCAASASKWNQAMQPPMKRRTAAQWHPQRGRGKQAHNKAEPPQPQHRAGWWQNKAPRSKESAKGSQALRFVSASSWFPPPHVRALGLWYSPCGRIMKRNAVREGEFPLPHLLFFVAFICRSFCRSAAGPCGSGQSYRPA